MDNQITSEQAWTICNMSRASWNRLRKDGKTPKPINRIGRNWLYDESEVRLFAATRKRQA